MADTPVQRDPTGSSFCPSFPKVSCSRSSSSDMFMNYMDYSPDYCMNLFTEGQKKRMRANFFTGEFGYRRSFIDNYFKIKDIDINACSNNTLTLKLQNVHCLPVTWSVSGATKVSESSQGVKLLELEM